MHNLFGTHSDSETSTTTRHMEGIMEERTEFLLQNADIYKTPIWIMRFFGHARISDTENNPGRYKEYVKKIWNFGINLVNILALLLLVLMLIERGRLGGKEDTVGPAIFVLNEAYCIFFLFWIGKKADTIKTLMFIHEVEYSKRKHEYGFVKAFSFYAILLLQSSTTILFNLVTILQFFKDEYVQQFYDSFLPSFRINISSTGCPLILRAGAVSITVLFTFFQTFVLQNLFGIILVMLVFTKRHYDLILSTARYDRTEDLKKTGKLISNIELLVKNLNDVFSLLLLIVVTTTILLFSIVVVYFFDGIDIRPGIEFQTVLVILSGYVVGALLAGVTVLYYDRKLDGHVRRIYRLSAQMNPRNTDFAIQAESLAQQIHSTKVIAKLWKFYDIDRMALLDLYSCMCSYVILVAKLMPAAMDAILRQEE